MNLPTSNVVGTFALAAGVVAPVSVTWKTLAPGTPSAIPDRATVPAPVAIDGYAWQLQGNPAYTPAPGWEWLRDGGIPARDAVLALRAATPAA